MVDQVKFLREKSARLRELGLREPAVAEALRRLADEVDAKADDLENEDAGDPDAETR